MADAWDKLTDPVEQKRQHQEMIQRVHGKKPAGRFVAPLIYWGFVVLGAIALAKIFG